MLAALIAEDELLVRMGISIGVPWSELDIAIVGEAKDGAEACQLYQKHRPDIFIPDILMRKMSGVEALERIRQIDQRALQEDLRRLLKKSPYLPGLKVP